MYTSDLMSCRRRDTQEARHLVDGALVGRRDLTRRGAARGGARPARARACAATDRASSTLAA